MFVESLLETTKKTFVKLNINKCLINFIYERKPILLESSETLFYAQRHFLIKIRKLLPGSTVSMFTVYLL